MERKKLEGEFSEFLIQKIKHAGGSLSLQHLYGILQYATFEMRKEFGTTKHELMKFLKGHSEIFYTDLSGLVTVTPLSIDNPVVDDDIYDGESTATVIENIENGFGTIVKLHPEFGIIKAIKPIETEVYFKSDVLCDNQDKLLIDSLLEVGYEVFFNAVYGHDSLDIKFLATKVWLKLNENVNCDHLNENQNNNFEGEGVIEKILSEYGFIVISGKKKEIVFFNKYSVIDCNGMELTKFFSVGDPVSFSARKNNEINSKCQWQATVVKKKSKEKAQSTSHMDVKTAVENRIKNVAGKIYPHSHGAIIKFRNSKLADGDSSDYFLYGIKVSNVSWEFSEGDDVWFDAVKTKSAPGWKAICVWVGEKPEYDYSKLYSNEEMQGGTDQNSACYRKSNSTVSLKSKTLKSESDIPTSQEVQNKSRVFDHAVGKNIFQHDFECKRQNSESDGSFQNFPAEKSNRRGVIKPRKEISSMKENKNSQNGTVSERLVKHRPKQKKSTVNRFKDTRLKSNGKIDGSSIHSDKNFKDEDSDVSEKSFSDDGFLSESFKSEYQKNYVQHGDNETDNKIKHYNSSVKGRSSIKTFEDIEGKIVNLYCKVAIVKCTELQRNIDFLLNVFYRNGKSVEEQQVIDLKEIVSVGDHVNINCFEIIDDLGEIHQKVTLAWIGPKPVSNVYEMTPREFIDEFELCVTLSDELVSGYLLGERRDSENSPEETFDETTVIEHNPDVSSDVSNIQTFQHIKIEEPDEQNSEEDNLPIPTHNLLLEMINYKLKSKGLIPADLQVDFSDMLTQIIGLTQNSNINSYKYYTMNKENVEQVVCPTCAEKRNSVFSGVNKTEKDAAVQTIITGGIIAQSIYTQS